MLATLWMLERVFEIDLGTDGIVEGFVTVPQGYVLAAIGTIVAAAIWMRGRSNGELLDTASLR